MSTTTAPQVAEGLVGFWADSPFPADRRQVLQLWREESGELVLTTATRWTPSATWPPSVLVRRGVSPELAAAAAADMGLVAYHIRREGIDDETDATRRQGRRAIAYARGREDCRRMPLGTREHKLARAALATTVSDQGRAYWLGVRREARS